MEQFEKLIKIVFLHFSKNWRSSNLNNIEVKKFIPKPRKSNEKNQVVSKVCKHGCAPVFFKIWKFKFKEVSGSMFIT